MSHNCRVLLRMQCGDFADWTPCSSRTSLLEAPASGFPSPLQMPPTWFLSCYIRFSGGGNSTKLPRYKDLLLPTSSDLLPLLQGSGHLCHSVSTCKQARFLIQLIPEVSTEQSPTQELSSFRYSLTYNLLLHCLTLWLWIYSRALPLPTLRRKNFMKSKLPLV